MKTKILKKINKLIRIIENKDGQFEIQVPLNKVWVTAPGSTYNTFKQALAKKHAKIIMIILRDLGYRSELIKRRTNNKK
jgi:hypothetical protein